MARRGRSVAVISILAVGLLLLGLGVIVRGGGGAAPQLPSTGRIYEALAEAGAVVILAVGLLTLAVTIWAFPRPIPGKKMRPPRRSWWSMLVTVGVGYVLIGILIISRPHLAARPAGIGAGLIGRPPLSTGSTAPSTVDWLGFGFGAAIVLCLALVVAWRLFGRRSAKTDEPADAIVAGVEAGLEELRSIQDPREAVIRAYAAMERVFSTRGLGRRPYEAPTEYLLRLVPGSADRGDAASRLTRAYLIARFSLHAVPPSMKQQAIAALEAMRSTAP